MVGNSRFPHLPRLGICALCPAPRSPSPGRLHIGSAASFHPQTGRAAGACEGPGRGGAWSGPAWLHPHLSPGQRDDPAGHGPPAAAPESCPKALPPGGEPGLPRAASHLLSLDPTPSWADTGPREQAGVSQEAHLTPCSLQKPQAPEARPKLVGTGPPAKPVLLRSTPKPLTPAPLAKAPRPPTKPVAAPILAQDRSSPETSECPVPAGLRGRPPRMDWEVCLTLPPGPQLCPAPSWSGTPHSTRSTSRSPRSRSRTSSGSTSSRPRAGSPRPSGQLCPSLQAAASSLGLVPCDVRGGVCLCRCSHGPPPPRGPGCLLGCAGRTPLGLTDSDGWRKRVLT